MSALDLTQERLSACAGMHKTVKFGLNWDFARAER